ncbi:MAG: NTP transferase domain-containing protein [Haloplanus sp.]
MSLPVRSPPFAAADEGSDPVAGVLLAAGTSSRFGDANKLLADVAGDPVVRRAARTLIESRVDPVVVVVGHEADRVRAALSGLDVTVVANPDYADGQATSVRAGIRAVSEAGADAAVVALGDMPFVRPRSVELLVAAYRADAGDPLAAAYRGERGNPVLFGARHFDALRAVDGDVGGRRLVRESGGSALVETDDPGVRRDVDEPTDLPRSEE